MAEELYYLQLRAAKVADRYAIWYKTSGRGFDRDLNLAGKFTNRQCVRIDPKGENTVKWLIETVDDNAMAVIEKGTLVNGQAPVANEVQYDRIVEVVESVYGYSMAQFLTKSRKRIYVEPRQMVHYFCCKFDLFSLVDIGRKTGGQDHATVIHSRKTIENLVLTNKVVRERFEQIDKSL